tara:strand:+ start:19943 stop:21703 length:1761 start_codon:yes stop_codon:yes gene_type:complete
MANIVFKLNGQVVNPVRDWQDLQVLATWSENGGSANISVEEFNFVNENAVTIQNYIQDGLNGGLGIFEGMPFDIEYSNGQTINIFNGILDFTDMQIVSPIEVKCKIKKLEGIDQFIDRTNGVTYAFLYDTGFLTDSDFTDIPYIVEKPFKESAGEMALLTLSIFLFSKQLVDSAKSLVDKLGINQTAHTVGGISGPAAGLGYSIATVIAESIYTGVILAQLIVLITDFLELLIPPIRIWKGTKIKTLLEKGCSYIGYNYNSSIEELNNLYILPSKNDEGKNILDLGSNDSIGYPDTLDYGYTVGEMITLINNMFSARIKIVGNQVYQEPLINDNFWVNQSQFIIPDIENEVINYNTDEINTRTIVRYQTDLSDYWTLIDYLGTGVEVLTTPITKQNDKAVLIKGFNEIQIPYALGSDKKGLNPIENAMRILAKIMDELINLFGGNSSREQQILAREGMLHVTGDSLSVGKILFLTSGANGLQAVNNHSIISAEKLYNKYISENSFVKHNFRGQKQLFEELKIPFGFENFLQVINNSYCSDSNGNIIKIESLKWSFDKDFALISGWTRKIYTKNLKETVFLGLKNQL